MVTFVFLASYVHSPPHFKVTMTLPHSVIVSLCHLEIGKHAQPNFHNVGLDTNKFFSRPTKASANNWPKPRGRNEKNPEAAVMENKR